MSTARPPQAATSRPGSTSTTVYVVCVSLCALVLVVLGWSLAGWPDDLVAVAVLCGMGAASWVLRDRIGSNRFTLSFTSIILLAAAVIVGPVGAAAVGAVTPIVQRERAKVVVHVFNAALFSVMGSVGGLAYILAGGEADQRQMTTAADILLHVGLPLIVANVSQCLVNAFLLSGRAAVRHRHAVPHAGLQAARDDRRGHTSAMASSVSSSSSCGSRPTSAGSAPCWSSPPCSSPAGRSSQYGDEVQGPRAHPQGARHRRRDQGAAQRRPQPAGRRPQ